MHLSQIDAKHTFGHDAVALGIKIMFSFLREVPCNKKSTLKSVRGKLPKTPCKSLKTSAETETTLKKHCNKCGFILGLKLHIHQKLLKINDS